MLSMLRQRLEVLQLHQEEPRRHLEVVAVALRRVLVKPQTAPATDAHRQHVIVLDYLIVQVAVAVATKTVPHLQESVR